MNYKKPNEQMYDEYLESQEEVSETIQEMLLEVVPCPLKKKPQPE